MSRLEGENIVSEESSETGCSVTRTGDHFGTSGNHGLCSHAPNQTQQSVEEELNFNPI